MPNKLLFIFLLFFFNCNGRSIPGIENKKTPETVKDSIEFNYDSTINELKSTLSNDFIIKTSSCFVIASNLTENETRKIIDNTIASAEECFYNDYFEIKPDEVIKIFLFKDDKTYKFWAKTLYNDYDDLSPYGYYKSSKKAMLMNINTGSGTLVHEMTHAFVRYDFPDIPSWFNEGLGSLYERCSLNNKKIIGYVNWRLPRLQKDINDKSYKSIDYLVNTGDEEFYGENSGFNYAQARYLCMYLQEKELLKKFYKTFRSRYSEDITGKKFLEEILNKNISDIDFEFKSWVMTLKLND
ncbi:MAG TPA: hypothetical protein VIL99_12110 [Ignavibacteria bacterium]